MNDTIRTTCPDCGVELRVEVTFPGSNRGFDPKECACPICGVCLIVTDPHLYNDDDGTLVD